MSSFYQRIGVWSNVRDMRFDISYSYPNSLQAVRYCWVSVCVPNRCVSPAHFLVWAADRGAHQTQVNTRGVLLLTSSVN